MGTLLPAGSKITLGCLGACGGPGGLASRELGPIKDKRGRCNCQASSSLAEPSIPASAAYSLALPPHNRLKRWLCQSLSGADGPFGFASEA
jgi:hypothetical protein